MRDNLARPVKTEKPRVVTSCACKASFFTVVDVTKQTGMA